MPRLSEAGGMSKDIVTPCQKRCWFCYIASFHVTIFSLLMSRNLCLVFYSQQQVTHLSFLSKQSSQFKEVLRVLWITSAINNNKPKRLPQHFLSCPPPPAFWKTLMPSFDTVLYIHGPWFYSGNVPCQLSCVISGWGPQPQKSTRVSFLFFQTKYEALHRFLYIYFFSPKHIGNLFPLKIQLILIMVEQVKLVSCTRLAQICHHT